MALMTYEVFYNESEEGGAERAVTSHPITLHGSLLLQAMLKFKDTKVVIRSILKMSSEELVRVSCDSNGSHIITTFMNSSTVPVKKRGRLIKRLEVSNLKYLFLCATSFHPGPLGGVVCG